MEFEMPIKPFLLIIFIVCSGFTLQDGKSSISRWVITGDGSLKVGGTTNINKFSCDIINFLSPDTVVLCKDFSLETIKMSGSILLDIKRFDCYNAVMTKDLRKALKARDFPRMQIRFINLGWYPETIGNPNEVTGLVSISLAGITKKFEVNYTVTYKGANSMQLKGTRRITFSDFKIIPPGKLGGMVKTHNDLNVEFNLSLAQL